MYLLFDIGGTKTRVAVSKDGKEIGRPEVFGTPTDNFEEGIRKIVQAATALAKGERIEAAAGGIAGPLDRKKTMLANSPNIGGWIQKPLKRELEEKLAATVLLDNDTAVIGLGEYFYGAARGKDIVVYMTVSTGVGGARIVRGKVDESAMGFEPGHQIIDPTGNLCPLCGGRGELEERVSGTAVEHRYGKKPYEIEDGAVWEELAEWLAIGLTNTIVHWSPDVVVLGGSMITGSPSIPLDAVRKHMQKYLTIFPEAPEIRKAELQDIGGLYGALAMIKEAESSAPALRSSSMLP